MNQNKLPSYMSPSRHSDVSPSSGRMDSPSRKDEYNKALKGLSDYYLKPVQNAIIWLHDNDDLSFRQIDKILGISAARVQKIYQAAVDETEIDYPGAELDEDLEDELDDDDTSDDEQRGYGGEE